MFRARKSVEALGSRKRTRGSGLDDVQVEVGSAVTAWVIVTVTVGTAACTVSVMVSMQMNVTSGIAMYIVNDGKILEEPLRALLFSFCDSM